MYRKNEKIKRKKEEYSEHFIDDSQKDNDILYYIKVNVKSIYWKCMMINVVVEGRIGFKVMVWNIMIIRISKSQTYVMVRKV